MSRAGESTATPARPRRAWLETVATVVVPTVLAGVSMAVLWASPVPPSSNLSLVTVREVEPGETIGLRALAFAGLDQPGSLRVVDAPVTVSLCPRASASTATDASNGGVPFLPWLDDEPEGLAGAPLAGAPLVEVTLSSSRSGGQEGSLALPRALPAALVLRATATFEGRRHEVTVPVATRHPASQLPVGERVAPRLQQAEVLFVRRESPEFRGQVHVITSNGGCVPDELCVVTAEVPGVNVEVHIEPRVGLAPLPDGRAPGFLRARLYGPEAEVEVRTSVGGVLVETRRVRLAVIMGGAPFDAPASLPVGATNVPLRFPARDAGRTFVVDAFHGGRWRAATSFVVGPEGHVTVPLKLEPGRWRLQVRRDALGFDDATSAAFLVGDPGPSLAIDADLAGVIRLPDGVGSLAEEVQRATRRFDRVKTLAVVVWAIGLVVVVLVLLLRSVRASREAQVVFAAADATPPVMGRLRNVVSTLLILFMVLLAFVAGVVLMLLRGSL